jgi:hypothetical protein
MKLQVTNYTFNKTTKQVTFNDYTAINLDSVLLITNVTSNKIIYNFASNALGGTASGNVLTLNFNTSAMADTDSLQIFYEDRTVMPATESAFRSLIRALKPLSVVTGGGINRLIVDVQNILGTVSTITTVTTVTTVGTVSNQTNLGNVSGYSMQQALARTAFADGIRRNLI